MLDQKAQVKLRVDLAKYRPETLEAWVVDLLFSKDDPFKSSFIETRRRLFQDILEGLDGNAPRFIKEYQGDKTELLKNSLINFASTYRRKADENGTLPLAGMLITAHIQFRIKTGVAITTTVGEHLKSIVKDLSGDRTLEVIDDTKPAWIAISNHPYLKGDTHDALVESTQRIQVNRIGYEDVPRLIEFLRTHFDRSMDLVSLIKLAVPSTQILDIRTLPENLKNRILVDLMAMDHPHQIKYREAVTDGPISTAGDSRLQQDLASFWAPFGLSLSLNEQKIIFQIDDEQ
jgi:hypothetical protein